MTGTCDITTCADIQQRSIKTLRSVFVVRLLYGALRTKNTEAKSFKRSPKTEPERNRYRLNARGVYCLNTTALMRTPGKETP